MQAVVEAAVARAAILVDGNRFGPLLVPAVDAPVHFFVLHGVGKHIERPVEAKRLHHLLHGLFVQRVVEVILRDCGFNRVPTGDVGLMGRPILFPLSVLPRKRRRVGIDGDIFQGFVPRLLFLDFQLRPLRQDIAECVHITGFYLAEILVHVGQRGVGF